MEEFLDSSLCREIQNRLEQLNIPKTTGSFAGPCIALWSPARGHVYVLIIQDDDFPGSNLIEITDEKLLEKLRSVNGQFTSGKLPVFYYEHLMSTADYKVYAKTGQLPTLGGQ
jgi:hypothetical protein